MNQPWIYMCSPSQSPLPPPSSSHPSGSSQCTSPEHLSRASNLGWWSVSPLIVYLFQCSSLRTSHPCLLLQSPKVCSIHLCLFFCFAYRVIITISSNETDETGAHIQSEVSQKVKHHYGILTHIYGIFHSFKVNDCTALLFSLSSFIFSLFFL